VTFAEAKAGCTEYASTTWVGGWLSAIQQIANIARVPTRNLANLRRKIASEVSDVNLNWPNGRKNWSDHFRRVYDARLHFVMAAIELESVIADFDEAYGKINRLWDVAPKPIDKLLDDIFAWDDSPCLLTLAVKYARAEPSPGRPESEKTDLLWLFAVLLTAAVENAGGRLEFNKNYPTEGSLHKALELLRP
jgi:hypothetical protein